LTGAGRREKPRYVTHEWREYRVEVDVAQQDGIVGRLATSTRRRTDHGDAFFLRDRIDGRPTLRIFVAPGGDGLRALLDNPAGWREIAGVRPWDGVSLPIDGPDAHGVMSGFLCGVFDVLLDAAATVAAGHTSRTHVAFDLMLAHLAAVAAYLPGDDSAVGALVRRYRPVPLSFPSLRAHRDGLIHLSNGGAALEQRLASRYAAGAPAIERRARALLARLIEPVPGGAADLAVAWFRAVRVHQDRARAALEAGRLTIADGDMAAADPSIGALHALTASSAALRAYLSGDRGYLSMRVMMSLLYLALHFGLGVSLADRLVLCDTVSRACESLAGSSSAEIMNAFVAALPQQVT
jgi:Lantibiotic biosynthesis dehydratase C-term